MWNSKSKYLQNSYFTKKFPWIFIIIPEEIIGIESEVNLNELWAQLLERVQLVKIIHVSCIVWVLK